MAEIVLVHGIDQQQKSADKLESAWLPALAGGVREAGFGEVADRIWRNAGKPGSIEARMAFYGSLFLTPGQQGDEPAAFTLEEALDLASALVLLAGAVYSGNAAAIPAAIVALDDAAEAIVKRNLS